MHSPGNLTNGTDFFSFFFWCLYGIFKARTNLPFSDSLQLELHKAVHNSGFFLGGWLYGDLVYYNFTVSKRTLPIHLKY